MSQDDTAQHLQHKRQYQYGWPSAKTVTETVTVYESCAPSTVTISVREPSTATSRTSGLWTGTGSSPSSATSAPYGNGTLPSYSAPGTGTIPLPTGSSTAPQSSSKTSGIWGTGTGHYPPPPSSTGIYSNTSSIDAHSQTESSPPETAYPTGPWGTGHPAPPPSSTGVFPNTSTPLIWPTSGWPGNVTGHSSTPTSSPHPTVTPLNLTSVGPTYTHHSSLPLTTGTSYPTGPAPYNGTHTWQTSSSSHATKPPGSYSWPSPPATLHTGGTSSSLPKPSSSVPYSNITSSTSQESPTVTVSPYPSVSHSTTWLPVANSSSTIPHLHTTITETVDTTVISTHTYTPSASAVTSVLPADVTSPATSVTPSSSTSSSESTNSHPYSSSKLPLASSSDPLSSQSSTYTPSFSTSVKTSTSSSPPAYTPPGYAPPSYTPPSYGQGSSGGEGSDSYSGGDSSGSKLRQGEHSRGGKEKHHGDEDEDSRLWSYGSRYRGRKNW